LLSEERYKDAGINGNSTTSSSLKTKVLHSLMENSPSSTKIISSKLDVHQSSISHVVKDMVRQDLIAKTDKGYMLTNIGRLHVTIMDSLHATFGAIERQKDFILSHNLFDVPMKFQTQVGIICNQQEQLNTDISTPFRKQEYLTNSLKNSNEIRGISSVISSEHARAIIHAIKQGADVDMIITDRVLQVLKDEYTAVPRETPVCRNLKIRCIDEIKLSLWVTEKNMFLGLHRLDGSYDFENIIICKDQDAIEWGHMLFRHYLGRTKLINDPLLSSS